MDISVKLAPAPWEIGGLRATDVDGSQIGRVAVYVEAELSDTDGFEHVELVKVDAATVAKIADGTDADPATTVQAIVDVALVGVKERVLAERAAAAAEEQAARDVQAANDAKVAKVRAAFAGLSAKAVGAVVEALED